MKSALQLICLMFLLFACEEPKPPAIHKLHGKAFGTQFNISYFNGEVSEVEVQQSIQQMFDGLNASLSTYIPDSDISNINKGDTTVRVDAYFKEVFEKSKRIYNETEGVFDPTIGALVNARGFGPQNEAKKLDSLAFDALLQKIGFDKVHLVNDKIIQEEAVYFDFNALAKGYALDLVGRYLEGISVTDYLIEIGGEIRTRGLQLEKNKPWTVAIEKPNFDGTRSIDKVIQLNNASMATSGGYRKFRLDSLTGKKYIHIVNPKTGDAFQSNLLSVSVVAEMDCADVDGYATALLAMGLEKAKSFLNARKDLMAVLIFSDADGNLAHFVTSNFEGLHDGF